MYSLNNKGLAIRLMAANLEERGLSVRDNNLMLKF